jgi:hypothetical protein
MRGDCTVKYLKVISLFLTLAIAAGAQQQTQKNRSVTAFDQLKSLAGDWEGTVTENGQIMSATTTFRTASGGTVVINDLGPGTPHEMITIFHQDGQDLLATHYCVMNNQPRMKLVPTSEPDVIAFEFKDATNLPSPAVPHVVGVKFTLLDANHHIEDWTSVANGQTSIRRFEFHRK